jgi:hypothetical protein
MRDNELILEILHQIEKSARKVVQRFQAISKPKDFTDTPAAAIFLTVPWPLNWYLFTMSVTKNPKNNKTQ